MGLTRLAISRPIAILMLVAAFLIVGLIGYKQLPEELQPDITYPVISVSTSYAGTSPQEMETLITKPIEDSIAGVSGIEEIDSTSEEGVSSVRINFYFGTDLATADAEVIQDVDAIRSRLPAISTVSPSVKQANTNGRPVLTYAMQSKTLSQTQLQTLATNVVQPALEQATDVGEVDVSQVTTRELHVDLDPNRLAAYDITIPQVAAAIGNANVNVASGFLQNSLQYYDVRLVGEFSSVNELADLQLPLGSLASATSVASAGSSSSSGAAGLTTPTGGLSSSSSSATGGSIGSGIVALSDLGTVSDTIAEPTNASFFNGQQAVQISILLITDGNVLAAVKSCNAQLKAISNDLPPGVTFTTSYDQSQQVTENLADVVVSLFLGALLAILVVYVFLHNARGTLIVAIAIPTSMIATFVPMWALHFSLNQFSLLGLSLAVGILVDDSIVVLENINRHLQLGEEPVVAAINGRTEIGLAAFVLTAVDLVVFLPIAFMSGVVGLLFRPFALTVAFATLFSLFVSFTLTPMLAARWYRKGESIEASDRFAKAFDRGFERVEHGYQRILRWGISHPWVIVGVSTAFIVVIFMTIGPQLGFRFAPDQDQGRVTVVIEAPAGSSVGYTERITNRIQDIIRQTPDLAHDIKFVATNIGSSGPGLNITGTQYANLNLTLYDRSSILDDITFWKKEHLRNRSDVDVSRELTKKVRGIVGARILPSNVSGFGGGGAPLAINLTGPNQDKLVVASDAVIGLLKKTPGVYNIDSSFQTSQPEVQVRLDRTLAAQYGLNLETVATSLADAIAGDISVQYRDPTDGEQYNIRVELAKQYRETPQEVSNITVGYANGNPIRLGDVAQVTLGSGPVQLTRLNRQREVQVTGYILPGYSVGKITYKVLPEIANMHLSQVQAVTGGETQRLGEELPNLIAAFVLGIFLTYMLMAALFNNLAYPFSIMLSLPQAWAGGVIALYIAGEQLSLISMIGVVLLNAIVNKNAILLVDYTNTLRARGYKREDALLLAGPTRLRPIMMTTFTILVSTLPTALALGRGAGFRQSLGVVVEGGIILSLLLTLIVVPSAYVLYDNLTLWLHETTRAFNERHQTQFGGSATAGLSGDVYSPEQGGEPFDAASRTENPAPVSAVASRNSGSNYPGGDGGISASVSTTRGGGTAVQERESVLPPQSIPTTRRDGSGSGEDAPRPRIGGGKYGGMTIRSRRPDELFQRSVKGDGTGNANANGGPSRN